MAKKEPKPLIFGLNITNKRKCLARCYNARSGACHCICDGVNHGIETEREEPIQQSFTETGLRFTAKDDFFANALRSRSAEVDFGAWWRDGHNYPQYRVSWIEETGEVYAIEQNLDDRVEVLGRARTREEVDKKLDGWAGICGLMNSLEWVRRNLA